jgi:hypothetical protein
MTKTLRLTHLALGLGLLAGCGASSGFLRDATSSQRFDYTMSVSGVRYLKSVSGTSSNGSLFCVIPTSADLYQQAMQSLYASAQLQPNQVVMNLREDYAFRSYLFFCSRQLTLSGDVFELTPATHGAAPAR